MIIPSGFAQCTMGFAGNGLANPAAVVFGIDQGGGANPDDVAEQVYDTWVATILNQQCDDITLVSCLVKFGPNDTGPSAEFTGNDPGVLSASGAVSNTAYLVRKNTSLGGRKGRGRMYLPGVVESTVGSDGAIDPTPLASLQLEVTGFGNVLTLGSLPMVLLHNDATAPTPVTSLVVQGRVATQRRRLRR
jgi:hypothetical protein